MRRAEEGVNESDSRVALYPITLTELALFNAVDFGKLDVLLLQGSSSLFIVRGQGLAVSAPRKS